MVRNLIVYTKTEGARSLRQVKWCAAAAQTKRWAVSPLICVFTNILHLQLLKFGHNKGQHHHGVSVACLAGVSLV